MPFQRIAVLVLHEANDSEAHLVGLFEDTVAQYILLLWYYYQVLLYGVEVLGGLAAFYCVFLDISKHVLFRCTLLLITIHSITEWTDRSIALMHHD